MQIVDATPEDGAACAAIYAPYVRDTVITFELEPPSAAEMTERIVAAQAAHAWIVAREANGVVGYAYGSRFAQRPAYRWACEVSVYLETGRRRTGLGRALYTELFQRLEARNYRRLFAGMTLPNDSSDGLHRALGFESVGVLRAVGWKHGAWHDVAWMQRTLGDSTEPPAEPR